MFIHPNTNSQGEHVRPSRARRPLPFARQSRQFPGCGCRKGRFQPARWARGLNRTQRQCARVFP
jgi:hypothetical protein